MRDAAQNRKRASHLLVCVLRNEAFRLPYFLNYYKTLGIDHFIIIDNESDDNIDEVIEGRDDLTLLLAAGSYRDTNFGLDWQNHVLWKYCSNKWTLIVDPDEIFTYPYSDTRDIKELTKYLDEINRPSLACMLVDMYGEGDARGWQCKPSQNPLEVCRFFDAYGYTDRAAGRHAKWVQGGPRMRIFFRHNPQAAPALNKIPLVFWRDHYALKSSTHTLWPRPLNKWHGDAPSLTGALLHFKFAAKFLEKISEEADRRQHYNMSIEYSKYLDLAKTRLDFMCTASRPFSSWRDLEQAGLLSRGYWF